MTLKLYLDSCIFIAHYCQEASNDHYNRLNKFIEFVKSKENIELYASQWTLTETIKVLIVEKHISTKKVMEYGEKLMRESRLSDLKFHWLKVEDKKKYDLDEFFYNYQLKILQNRIGTADIIHLVLMDLFEIKNILTFNEKDFTKFKKIKVLKPEDVLQMRIR